MDYAIKRCRKRWVRSSKTNPPGGVLMSVRAVPICLKDGDRAGRPTIRRSRRGRLGQPSLPLDGTLVQLEGHKGFVLSGGGG